MRSLVRLAIPLFAPLVVSCADDKSADAAPRASATAQRVVAQGGTLTGTLREQIPVAPYVYLRLATEAGEVWAAVSQAPLTIGASVTVYNVLPMEGFASQTLNRTFERIYFGSLDPSGGAMNGEMNGATSGTNGGNGAAAMPDGMPPADDAQTGPVARARGANARTIGELWSEKERLVGKTVSVNGVVVKYNAAVMGKNWIHLQDGSGSAAHGTHDVAVTSMDAVTVGDTVTVTGTVRTNRDLGAGYTFALLVEDATVARSARAVPISRTR